MPMGCSDRRRPVLAMSSARRAFSAGYMTSTPPAITAMVPVSSVAVVGRGVDPAGQARDHDKARPPPDRRQGGPCGLTQRTRHCARRPWPHRTASIVVCADRPEHRRRIVDLCQIRGIEGCPRQMGAPRPLAARNSARTTDSGQTSYFRRRPRPWRPRAGGERRLCRAVFLHQSMKVEGPTRRDRKRRSHDTRSSSVVGGSGG